MTIIARAFIVAVCHIAFFFCVVLCLNSCNPDDNDQDKNNDVSRKKLCLYGDSTLDASFLYDYLKEKSFTKVYNRCVCGSGYVNGYVNTVYYDMAKADTAVRIYFGDPVNTPERSNLPEGVYEIDAHQYSYERIKTIPQDCDIILIGGGINDIGFISETSIGEYKSIEDLSRENNFNVFGDCVISTIQRIKQRCPYSKILVLGISPSKGILNGGADDEMAICADRCIRQICTLMDIPFYSLMENLGWNVDNIMEYTDGVHPNTENGRFIYAEAICSFLESSAIAEK